MTVETKTTLQLNDITAVEFECKNCHSVIAWPLNVAKNPPTNCQCRPDQQWMAYGGDMFAAMSNFLELMRRLGKADKEPFTMRFVVSAPLGRVSDSKV